MEGSHRGDIPRDEMRPPARRAWHSAQRYGYELIAASFAMVLMFRAVAFLAAGITGLDCSIPKG